MGVLFFATPRHEAGSVVKITSLGQNIIDLSALQNSLALQTEKLRKYNLLAEKVVDKAQTLAAQQISGGISNRLGACPTRYRSGPEFARGGNNHARCLEVSV